MMEVLIKNGIHLPGCDVWLDSLRSRSFGVVSHAHSDHAAWHDTTLLTPATAALMRIRRSSGNKTIHEIPYFQPYEHSTARITLLPAGHVLGSAQVFLECEGGTLLYTGDFKLRKSLTSEQAVPRKADTLVMECTFGRPRYRFPAAEVLREKILEFCRNTVAEKSIPVLLAYSIGKAQELLAILKSSGLKASLHKSISKMAKVYEESGISFGDYQEYTGGNPAGQVVIFPPHVKDQLSHLPNARFAIASGWAIDPSAIYRYRCQAAFPFSDHADYDELLEYVKLVDPKRVYLVHGFVEEFAQDLRQLGIEAWALGGGNQLEFPL